MIPSFLVTAFIFWESHPMNLLMYLGVLVPVCGRQSLPVIKNHLKDITIRLICLKNIFSSKLVLINYEQLSISLEQLNLSLTGRFDSAKKN